MITPRFKEVYMFAAGKSAYFATFREAASSATLPAVAEVKEMYDAAHICDPPYQK